MIIVYKKQTNKILGVASRVFDSGKWREAQLEEVYPDLDKKKTDVLVMKDSPQFYLRPNDWELKLDEKGVPAGVELKPMLPMIALSTNAKDTDNDGIPKLTADGKSKAEITITIKDEKGKLVKKETTLFLKTTGGSLSARRLTVKDGKAMVSLTSSLETVPVAVSVSGEGVKGADMPFEFMPSGG